MGTLPYELKLREKAVKITKDMKNVNVFKKLRIDRVNKYYKGKRDKKA